MTDDRGARIVRIAYILAYLVTLATGLFLAGPLWLKAAIGAVVLGAVVAADWRITARGKIGGS